MLRFSILGPLAVTDDEGRAVPIPAGRARTVLGLLCVGSGQVISSERLIDAAWDGSPPASAMTRLHSLVSDLRRALPGEPILTSGPGYVLAVAEDDIDLGAARLLAARARSARDRGETVQAVSCLSQALGKWRGRAFDGIACAELEAEAERIAHEHAGLLEEHAELELALGHHAAVAAHLTEWVARHPLREGMRASLMRALARSGRQAEAIATYHDLRGRLCDELGVEPSPHLQDLYQAILTGDRAEMAAPAGVWARVQAQLPAGASDFTGRTAEVALLSALLGRRAVGRIAPVVAVISGLAGIGKSALAVHASHLAAPLFPDGQLYVNLAGSSGDPAEPADVLAGLVRDLGLPAADVPAREAERAARYRSLLAGREVLVVLDDAHDAAQVRPLLPGSAGCAVLITSRNKLTGLAGTVPVDLGALAPDEGLDLFRRIVGEARAAGEPAATERVVSSCAGLPLAIRIAAAKLAARPNWSIARTADRLEEAQSRLTELQAGDLAVAASFQLSYDALPQNAAHAFRLLGLAAPGQFSSNAAAALFGTQPRTAEDLLEALVDANLLETPEQDQYRLHDLLRLFAAELARTEVSRTEREVATIRLLTWYAAGLRAAAQALAGGQSLPDCLPDSAFGGEPAPRFGSYQAAHAWCDREFTTLVWAVTTASSYERHDVIVAIACLLWFYARLTRVPDSFAAVQRYGLVSARALGNDEAEQRALTSLGGVLMWQGDHREALDTLLAALEVTRRGNVPRRVAAALDNVGAAHHSQGRYQEALKYQLQALALHRQDPEPGLIAVALSNLGGTHYEMGSYEQAIGCFREAIELTRGTGFKHGEAIARTGLGETYRLLGRLADAIGEHTAALSLHRELGSGHRSVIGALDKLAEAQAASGAVDDAREAWTEAIRIAGNSGDRRAAALRERLADLHG
jgi:DNA-binding SARP family transcriptional activator/tetratricopeptide (TPR) repeat protein